MPELSCQNQVILAWVLGYEGYQNNEMVNKLAWEGSDKVMTAFDPFCGVAKAVYKAFIEEWMQKSLRNGVKFQLAKKHPIHVNKLQF